MAITNNSFYVYSSNRKADILEISDCIIVFLYSRCGLSGLDHHNDFDNAAPSLFVAYFDSSKMTENKPYSE